MPAPDSDRAPLTLSPALETKEGFSLPELRELWMILSPAERVEAFRLLPRGDSEEFFLELHARDSAELLVALPTEEQRAWMRLLPPDDAADLAQAASADQRERLLGLLDDATRKEVNALLAYAEDEAGGLMNPRFARVRPDATVDEAITYLRRQARERLGSIYYVYVLDEQQRLRGVVSFRQLFSAAAGRRVADIMHRDVLSVREDQDQEEVSNLFAQHGFAAIPVVDADNRVKGIVTMDDIVEVVQEEATEDAHKVGGLEALDAPYLQISFSRMLKKRAGWLAALFLGEMLTATAMSHFEGEIARAVVLAMFVPLIISSGGNSGSQASTLVIRAMALEEVKLRDWWRVMRRELAAGVALGGVLGSIGFLRIVLWQAITPMYGPHYALIALTVFGSLIGVVMFGTLAGSLLPFLLRRVGWDPASASAPFVATLVDVTGLIIYFTVASIVLRGTLLKELPADFTATDRGGWKLVGALATDAEKTSASAADGASAGCGSILTGVLRDIRESHPDFAGDITNLQRGLVQDALGADGKPVLSANARKGFIQSADSFRQWFESVPGVSSPYALALYLAPSNGKLSFESHAFFPIDGAGFGNEGQNHNFSFTFELHTRFRYRGGEVFQFSGDDDLWVFINGHLALDLGGVHAASSQSIALDGVAARLGITPDNEYALDLFQAQRHATQSDFQIDTTLEFTSCGVSTSLR